MLHLFARYCAIFLHSERRRTVAQMIAANVRVNIIVNIIIIIIIIIVVA